MECDFVEESSSLNQQYPPPCGDVSSETQFLCKSHENGLLPESQAEERCQQNPPSCGDSSRTQLLQQPHENVMSNELSDEEQERRHFLKILAAFRNYYHDAMRRVDTNEKCFRQLSASHQAILEDFPDHLKNVRQCIKHNAKLICEITREASSIFTNASPYNGTMDGESGDDQCNQDMPAMKPVKISSADMDKVRSTLKQLVRDWSESGVSERQHCYAPVIESIRRFFPYPSADIKILVPGAGLGRLAWEIARLGYACQGNEWSLYMLIASNFVLNRCSVVNQFSLFPWSYQFCNNEKREHQLQKICFPDVNPSELPKHTDFSMAAGDFLEVYQEPESWDCIATVFFIDTAHNVVAYVESFWNLIKPGGYWINIGPLLYHYADIPGEVSIELTYEDLRRVIEKVGFEFMVEQRRYPTRYTQNPNSMLQYIYNSVFFVVRKPLEAQSGSEEN